MLLSFSICNVYSAVLKVDGENVSAVNVKRVVITRQDTKETEGLTSQDLEWQEQRRKRKVRRLDFEIR